MTHQRWSAPSPAPAEHPLPAPSEHPLPARAEHPLPLTGERTLPGVPRERYWFARHVAGYQRAAAAVARHLAGSQPATVARTPRHGAPAGPPRVLDAGCGEGYGADLLAAATAGWPAHHVAGVDCVPDVIVHAAARYPSATFCVAEVTTLPFAEGSFDAVVASQLIEHLWDVDAWVAETARVLVPGGVLAVLTPNRLTFSPQHGGPLNPFHVTEFAPDELVTALGAHMDVLELDGIGHGDRLAAIERRHGSSLPEQQAAAPAERWPGWVAEAVSSTGPGDFAPAEPPRSRDLVAVAARR